MWRKILPCLSLTLITVLSSAQDATEYIEIYPGKLPIILTVPHGGDLKPTNMLARRYGVTAKDSNTAELSLMIGEELQKLYGGKPHTLICQLHRSKVDCNRELSEAAQGDPTAIAAWKLFHGTADEMENQVTRDFGAGLTIDLHGHRHEEERVELGYLLPSTVLNMSDKDLESEDQYRLMSSVRELDTRSSTTFAKLIRGQDSLGAMLENEGFKSVPSPQKPFPGRAPYFSGAYTIAAHGSRDSGTISAIQIECPWRGVRDTEKNQRKFAQALARVLGDYFEKHFQMSLKAKSE
jgi:hypothetical protein